MIRVDYSFPDLLYLSLNSSSQHSFTANSIVHMLFGCSLSDMLITPFGLRMIFQKCLSQSPVSCTILYSFCNEYYILNLAMCLGCFPLLQQELQSFLGDKFYVILQLTHQKALRISPYFEVSSLIIPVHSCITPEY